MNLQERQDLYENMVASAQVFCQDEGIPSPTITFCSLDPGSRGYYVNTGCSIQIDLEQSVDPVLTFFHELIHHWQYCKIPLEWYRENGGAFGDTISFLQYAVCLIEIEARSFARSIVEELDAL